VITGTVATPEKIMFSFCRMFLGKIYLQAYLFYCMVVGFDTTSVLPLTFVAKSYELCGITSARSLASVC
jgi:hypothetical protein